MEHEHGRFFNLFAYNETKSVIYRFPAWSEEEAILETIDLILYKHEKHEEPWTNGTITLTNELDVVLLNIPDPSNSRHD